MCLSGDDKFLYVFNEKSV
jgi:hypothetical protein